MENENNNDPITEMLDKSPSEMTDEELDKFTQQLHTAAENSREMNKLLKSSDRGKKKTNKESQQSKVDVSKLFDD